MDTTALTIIGHIHTVYPEKFGIPRQSGLSNAALSYITLEGECKNQDCLRGLEEYSHIWLLWGFHANHHGGWSPTVRPPRLGGNLRKGVFATRSPYRPNPIGLSCVELVRIDLSEPGNPILITRGADMMDGTPIYDIKPYLPYTDSHPSASQSFAGDALFHELSLCFDESVFSLIPEKTREGILETLRLDPRPSYQDDPERIYGMNYGSYNIRFRVCDRTLTILEIQSTLP